MNKEKEQEFIEEFKKVNEFYIHRDIDGNKIITDNESYHIECDKILKNFIYKLGYIELLKFYETAEDFFWYS